MNGKDGVEGVVHLRGLRGPEIRQLWGATASPASSLTSSERGWTASQSGRRSRHGIFLPDWGVEKPALLLTRRRLPTRSQPRWAGRGSDCPSLTPSSPPLPPRGFWGVLRCQPWSDVGAWGTVSDGHGKEQEESHQRKARNAPSRGHFVPKPIVGGFGCLELVLYSIRAVELA